jgi:hypothetical protein
MHNSSHPKKSQADLNRVSVKGLKAVMNILDNYGDMVGDCATAGLPKPESFDFLGFTHSCAVLRDRRTFMLLRQTSVSRMRRTLHSVKDGLYRNRHRPVGEQKHWLLQ